MGKDIDGVALSISNRPLYCAAMVGLWLRLATCGYSQKTLRRLVGKIIWATRPGRAAYPFLAGCFAWLKWGPTMAPYTPPKVLRGLMEAMALAMHPWQAQCVMGQGDRWYVDAAKQFQSFYVGVWGRAMGPKSSKCPPWVKTQQAAELFAIECGLRMAANQGRRCITVVTDNLAAAHSAVKGKASIALRAQNRILRRMQHILRWSGMQVFVEWVPSHLNPADPPSRWAECGSPEVIMTRSFLIAKQLQGIRPQYFGCMCFRG